MPPLLVPEQLTELVVCDRRLAPFTTWGVGGMPRFFVTPRSKGDTASAVQWLFGENIGIEVLGGGSNVLIADGDLPLALLHMRELSVVTPLIRGEDIFVRCGAGVALRSVFSLALRSAWSGLEFAVGIPGTIGGAIMGNAGTRAGDMRGVVFEVQTVENDGSLRIWPAEEIEWAYRRCGLASEPGRILTEATLRLKSSSRGALIDMVKAAAASRRGQPSGAKTAGCVFKNPPGDSAGRLLDIAGCKLFSFGDARVSPVHANFIENLANCSADDILSLAQLCRRRVHERFGVLLEFEVKFIGVPAERLRFF